MKLTRRSMVITASIISALMILSLVGAFYGRATQHDGFQFIDTVRVQVLHSGKVVYDQTYHNLITNAGEDIISACTARGATGGSTCTNGGVYITLTTDSATALATDLTLTSEETTNGLQRVLGTYAHSASAITHTISNTFTYSGSTSKVIAKLGLFDAASTGNMMAETKLTNTATVNTNGDQIVVTWTLSH